MTGLINSDSMKTWQSLIISEKDKSFVNCIFQRISNVQQKLIQNFKGSIQLWKNLMILKMQSHLKQLKFFDDGSNKQRQNAVDRMTNQLTNMMNQTQESVLKGLTNIQKLYMVPELRKKGNIKSNEIQNQYINQQRRRSISIKKTRSSSYSSERNKKPSFFRKVSNNTKFQTMHNKDKSSLCDKFNKTLNQTLNSKILKQSKPRPKFQIPQSQSGSTAGSDFRHQSTNVSFELGRSVSDYFTQKQNKKQDNITQKVTNKLQQKLKTIETDLNIKINTILETIKGQSQFEKQIKQKNTFSSNNQQQSENNNNKNYTQNKGMNTLTLQNKQNIKRNSITKRIISNPIVEENIQLENIQLMKQTNRVSNKNAKLQWIQSNLKDFISLKKKIKLPITGQLMKIFMSGYLKIHSQLKKQLMPSIQKLGLVDGQIFQQLQQNSAKAELKQCFIKLKKLLSIDGLNSKVQKIKSYIDQCLRCSYDLILKEDYQIQQQTVSQVEIIIAKL